MDEKVDVYKSKEFMDKFAYVGKNVEIFRYALILNPEVIELDDNVRIDDFTKIQGGKGVKIGKCVHIASFSSVTGGGELIMEDFSGLSVGCRILTGSDDFFGKCMTNPCIPKEFLTHVCRSKVVIKRHAVLGANTIVLPGVTIGEGASIGAGAVVTKDIEPWAICIGTPAKKYKNRMKENILRMEKELIQKYF